MGTNPVDTVAPATSDQVIIPGVENAPPSRGLSASLRRLARSRPLAPLRWMHGKGRHLGMQFLLACGVDFYIRTDDRRVLETIILPFFAQGSEWRRILFVGCAWYTRGYRRLFAGNDYRTLEIDPREARYGTAQHIIDSVENIRDHFREGDLDVIICNGVFGWGLNERSAVDKAFQGCFESLRGGGILVLGWNDLPDRTPFPLETCPALQSFTPFVFPPLGSTRFLTGSGRHTYDFYLKGIAVHRSDGEELSPGS